MMARKYKFFLLLILLTILTLLLEIFSGVTVPLISSVFEMIGLVEIEKMCTNSMPPNCSTIKTLDFEPVLLSMSAISLLGISAILDLIYTTFKKEFRWQYRYLLPAILIAIYIIWVLWVGFNEMKDIAFVGSAIIGGGVFVGDIFHLIHQWFAAEKNN